MPTSKRLFATSSNWVGVLFKTSFSSYLSSEPSIWSPPSEQNTYFEGFSMSLKYFLGSVWWYQPLTTWLRRQTEALCESEACQSGVEEEKEGEKRLRRKHLRVIPSHSCCSQSYWGRHARLVLDMLLKGTPATSIHINAMSVTTWRHWKLSRIKWELNYAWYCFSNLEN